MTLPSSDPGRWSDLTARVASGAVMVAVGFAAVWIGGVVFNVFTAILCAVMVWELARMLVSDNRQIALQLGALAGAAVLLAGFLPVLFVLPVLVAPALVGVSQLPRHRVVFAAYTTIILLAGFGLISVRADLGLVWMLWLVLVVVVTDISGYFAGRMIGGPKFWPRFSPKKTWSGTAAGWVGAGIVGAIFAGLTGTGPGLIVVSVAVSFASQMGDIGESAVKRMTGVKDSSNLIPGHGGVLDRFDAMLGAAVFVLVIGQLIGFPSVPG